MGKIDKEKLLKELNKEIDGFGKIDVIKVQTVIKNFPEEQEIDMDQLRDEVYMELVKMYGRPEKSIKQFEIPVKRHWTLKKEYYDFAINMFQPISLMQTTDKEPKHKQYYDLHEEPDYSKITENSIIEAEGKLFYFHCLNSDGYPSLKANKTDTSSTDKYSKKGIRVVELAKE